MAQPTTSAVIADPRVDEINAIDRTLAELDAEFNALHGERNELVAAIDNAGRARNNAAADYQQQVAGRHTHIKDALVVSTPRYDHADAAYAAEQERLDTVIGAANKRRTVIMMRVAENRTERRRLARRKARLELPDVDEVDARLAAARSNHAELSAELVDVSSRRDAAIAEWRAADAQALTQAETDLRKAVHVAHVEVLVAQRDAARSAVVRNESLTADTEADLADAENALAEANMARGIALAAARNAADQLTEALRRLRTIERDAGNELRGA